MDIKKLSMIQHVATVRKCLKKDAKPGRAWCIYEPEAPTDNQPKGFPKTFETKTDAEEHLKRMQIFKQLG